MNMQIYIKTFLAVNPEFAFPQQHISGQAYPGNFFFLMIRGNYNELKKNIKNEKKFITKISGFFC